jgi:hypothetical protein
VRNIFAMSHIKHDWRCSRVTLNCLKDHLLMGKKNEGNLREKVCESLEGK